jgi:hypothetical protein
MVVNFRIRGINRDTHKLTRTSTLKKKKVNFPFPFLFLLFLNERLLVYFFSSVMPIFKELKVKYSMLSQTTHGIPKKAHWMISSGPYPCHDYHFLDKPFHHPYPNVSNLFKKVQLNINFFKKNVDAVLTAWFHVRFFGIGSFWMWIFFFLSLTWMSGSACAFLD